MRTLSFLAVIPLVIAAPALSQTAPIPGTVIIAVDPAGLSPEAIRHFEEAVGAALSDAGFTPLPGATARYRAQVSVTRRPRGEVAAGGSGLSADASLGNWGASAVVALPSAKTQIRGLIVTELTIILAPMAGQGTPWTRRALTVQPAAMPADRPQMLAPRLASAAMRDFATLQAEPATIP